MMRSVFSTTLAILTVFVFSSCNDYSTAENLSSDDFVPVRINDQYQINLPDYMSKTDELNDEASMQFMNGLKEAYVIVIDEPKADFEGAVSTVDDDGMAMSLLDYYAFIQIETFQSILTDAAEPVRKDEFINGLNAALYQLSGKMDGIGIEYNMGFYESETDLYMVVFWTLQERAVHFEDTFLTSLKSFKVLNQ